MPVNFKGHELFVDRLYDAMHLCSRRQKSVMTSFLTPSEQEIAKNVCRDVSLTFTGGHEGAERKRAILSEQEPERHEVEEAVCCLQADMDPYQPSLRHPDLLGALLRSGLEREVIGDILCEGGKVFVFCKPEMADFIMDNVVRAGRQTIRFEKADPNQVPEMKHEILQVNVSSLRYDSVVAALARCSRSKAEEMIRQGFVKINDVVLDQKGQLCNNDVVSIRRAGRFQFLSEKNRTRKNRLVLEFKKYS